jgi:sugar fermentation stimulation protein A
VARFAPGDSADPRYGELFRQALDAGVEVLPCRYGFSDDGIDWLGLATVQRRSEAP